MKIPKSVDALYRFVIFSEKKDKLLWARISLRAFKLCSKTKIDIADTLNALPKRGNQKDF